MEKPKYNDSKPQGKDDKTYNFRSTSTRKKWKRERGVKKTISIQNWLRRKTLILTIEMHVHYATDLLKQE